MIPSVEKIVEKEILEKKENDQPSHRECVDYACDLYGKRTETYDPCKREICPRFS